METISIFDMFKIGVGPSSSHTMGPWRAAKNFVQDIPVVTFDRITCTLYGSLAKTGKGHRTDIAVQLGFLGFEFNTIDTGAIDLIINNLNALNELTIIGTKIHFDPIRDIEFSAEKNISHPNAMEFSIWNEGEKVHSSKYNSIGGGFIEREGVQDLNQITKLPHPIQNSQDLRSHLKDNTYQVSQIVLQNEMTLRTKEEIERKIISLFKVMTDSVMRGLTTHGKLPGGLNVTRRAATLANKLVSGAEFNSFDELKHLINNQSQNFKDINNWISCIAMAVNEENANMGRIVTSPTNGAAGVIPAVLLYYQFFCEHKYTDHLLRFFCTAGEIGSLFKKGATISAAIGGCQAEIGVSSSMAAAGLTEILGGTANQALMAAEIAMEHHLGMTCDPIGGLVQIPCIERNAMGAIKAITAANLALESNPKNSIVGLDAVIKTMWETSVEMHDKYKETSEGGLAFNVPVIYPEC
ncbi:MAG: L-serine dehydratase [Glaciecola sp.]|jgi:L-serine dehydratase